MKEDDSLPALDNEDIRKLNTQKVVNTIDKLGDFLEEGKKTSKLGKIRKWNKKNNR